jgi:hypothetical protein
MNGDCGHCTYRRRRDSLHAVDEQRQLNAIHRCLIEVDLRVLSQCVVDQIELDAVVERAPLIEGPAEGSRLLADDAVGVVGPGQIPAGAVTEGKGAVRQRGGLFDEVAQSSHVGADLCAATGRERIAGRIVLGLVVAGEIGDCRTAQQVGSSIGA